MKQYLFVLARLCLGLCVVSGFSAQAQSISGTVYRDFDSNGERTQNGPGGYSEPGIAGVGVMAFNAANAVVASTTTSASGGYTLNTGPGRFRVLFTGFQTGDYVSLRGTQNRTDVRFVTAGSAPVDLALNYPAHYCGVPDPALLVPCYVNGNPVSASGVSAAGLRDVLVSVPYSASGLTPPETMVAKGAEIGSVYGLAVLRSANKLFSGAFTKRHVGFGPGGPGAIYLTNLTTNTSSLFTTLNAGADPHTNLPTDPNAANRDEGAFDAVGKVGLGDIELSDDNRMLYVVNLFDRRIYLIPLVSDPPAGADPRDFIAPGTITSVPVPDPGCGNGTYRPFALKFWRGKLYVGMVCSNESLPVQQSPYAVPAPGNAFVYAFDVAPATNTLSPVATQVLNFPLTYPKGATVDGRPTLRQWYAWGSNFYDALLGVPGRPADDLAYPQPWLTDLEFDVDGAMILGIRDRFGDQTGYQNLGTNPADAALYSSAATGDLLRAGPCGPAGTYVLESGGSVCGAAPTTAGTNGEGPGGGEFYDDNVFCCHGESSYGGLALLPGRGEVVNVSVEPLDLISAGFRYFDNLTGVQRRAVEYRRTGTQIYRSDNASTFGKANGLGDVELNCNAAPLQVGNVVWNDTNGNGRQDADETGIASVTLGLYQNGFLVASTQTDAEGEYYFGPTNVPGGLQPYTAYEIRIGLSAPVLAGRSVSVANSAGDDRIDADAIVNNGNAIVPFTTRSYGQNDFSIDFGFNTCPPQKCIPITVTRIRPDRPAGN